MIQRQWIKTNKLCVCNVVWGIPLLSHLTLLGSVVISLSFLILVNLYSSLYISFSFFSFPLSPASNLTYPIPTPELYVCLSLSLKVYQFIDLFKFWFLIFSVFLFSVLFILTFICIIFFVLVLHLNFQIVFQLWNWKLNSLILYFPLSYVYVFFSKEWLN